MYALPGLRFSFSLLLGLTSLPLLTGCGGGAASPDLRAASGNVTLNGNPVEGASISFFPTVQGGRSATGTTDASGNFKLSSFQKEDGALIGKYNVAITKFNPNYVMPEPGEEEKEPYNLLPESFGDPGTSGLSAEVTADGENFFEFGLNAN